MTRKALKWFFTGSTSRDIFFVLVVMITCMVLVILPTGFEDRIEKVDEHVHGEVISVDNSTVLQFGLVRSGTQVLEIRILEGSQKGRIVEAVNNLTGKMELDKYFEVGDRALVDLTINGDRATFANAADHYRIDVEIVLLGLFALLLILFGGFTGFKALLSFGFTGLALWKILIPLFLKGIDPILVSFSVVTLLTSVIIFLVGGINRKGLVAFLGAMLGLGLTCILSLVFSGPFHLHGAVKPFSETLLYSGFAHLNLTRIFLASIFLASSGAVMDLSMDIASALHEIMEHHPGITTMKLMRSGMIVGRMVIGTMTTTLLLAYSASYITMLMVFMGQGIPMVNILNLNYVAAEMLHTLVGSFGLVTVAPFTAVIGAVLYTRHRV
ncbi:MAG: YibE/F family protein [Synergistales bacterium]|nr:YibE/F family protein [Synergistales bacterium]